MQAKLVARDVVLEYYNPKTERSVLALDGVDIEINQSEFVSIVGTSGCGKTTFLKAVDGLIPIDDGELLLDGKEILGPGRDRAMVFQSPSLFPWRTVEHNVGYGLDLQGTPASVKKEKVQRFVELVGLQGFEDAYPSELSGGMQQRVNLARALAVQPELLLLDEPFASLDAQTREFMQLELMKIWTDAQTTAIFITHQIDEAIYLSDRVAVFTARPARVREVVPVNFPRPRDLRLKRDPEFLRVVDYIWGIIEEEARRAGLMTNSQPR